MDYRHTLPKNLIQKAASELMEFANGGMQVHLVISDGRVFSNVFISNCMWILSVDQQQYLPFSTEDIVDIYQTNVDENVSRNKQWLLLDDAIDLNSPALSFVLSMEKRGHLELSPSFKRLISEHQN